MSLPLAYARGTVMRRIAYPAITNPRASQKAN